MFYGFVNFVVCVNITNIVLLVRLHLEFRVRVAFAAIAAIVDYEKLPEQQTTIFLG